MKPTKTIKRSIVFLVFTFLFFATFSSFVQAKILIQEYPIDLSFRGGLEMQTEYYNGDVSASNLLQQSTNYYSFTPRSSYARTNINPPLDSTHYKEYNPNDPLAFTEEDLKFRIQFLTKNLNYWRFSAAGNDGLYGYSSNVGVALTTRLEKSGSLSREYTAPGTGPSKKTYSETIYDNFDRPVLTYFRNNPAYNYDTDPKPKYDKNYYSHNLSENGGNYSYIGLEGDALYSGFAGATTTQKSTMEGKDGIKDDNGTYTGSDQNGWDLKTTETIYLYNDSSYYDPNDACYGGYGWNFKNLPIKMMNYVGNPEISGNSKFLTGESYSYDSAIPPLGCEDSVYLDTASCEVGGTMNGKPLGASRFAALPYLGFSSDPMFKNLRVDAPQENYFTIDNRYDTCGNLRETKTSGYDYYDDDYPHANLLEDYSKVSYAGTGKGAFPTSIIYYGRTLYNTPIVKNAAYYTWTSGGSVYTSGALKNTTDENGKTTFYTYDTLGRITRVDYPDNGQVIYAYNTPVNGMWSVKIDQKQNSTQNVSTCYVYDYGGRLVQTQLKDVENTKLIVSDTSYDALGRVDKQSKPRDVSNGVLCSYDSPNWANLETAKMVAKTEYDALGRVIKVTNPDTTFVTNEYGVTSDSNRTFIKTFDEKRNYKTYTYDGFGNLVNVEESDGTTLSNWHYSYDWYGNLISIFSGNTAIEYNSYGYEATTFLPKNYDPGNPAKDYAMSLPKSIFPERVTSTIDNTATGRTFLYYDGLGHPVKTVAENSLVTETGYDKYYRVANISKYYAGLPTNKEVLSFFYGDTGGCTANVNATNRVCRMSDSQTTTDFEYDSMGRVTKQTKTIDGRAYALEFSYDLMGNLIMLKYPDNGVVTYAYNSLNKLSSAYYTNGTSVKKVDLNFVYNPTGTISEKKVTPNGVNPFYTTYSYNARDFLTSMYSSSQRNAGTEYLARTYGFDAVGNILTINNAVDLGNKGNMPALSNYSSFAYDNLNRLASETYYLNGGVVYFNSPYNYDSLGNRLTKTNSQTGLSTYSYQNGKLMGIQ